MATRTLLPYHGKLWPNLYGRLIFWAQSTYPFRVWRLLLGLVITLRWQQRCVWPNFTTEPATFNTIGCTHRHGQPPGETTSNWLRPLLYHWLKDWDINSISTKTTEVTSRCTPGQTVLRMLLSTFRGCLVAIGVASSRPFVKLVCPRFDFVFVHALLCWSGKGATLPGALQCWLGRACHMQHA